MDAGQLHRGHAPGVPLRRTHAGPSFSGTPCLDSSTPCSFLTMTFPKVSLLSLLRCVLWSPRAVVSLLADTRERSTAQASPWALTHIYLRPPGRVHPSSSNSVSWVELCPPKDVLQSYPQYPWLRPYLEICSYHHAKMRSSGRVLIQDDWCSYKKRKMPSEDRDTGRRSCDDRGRD